MKKILLTTIILSALVLSCGKTTAEEALTEAKETVATKVEEVKTDLENYYSDFENEIKTKYPSFTNFSVAPYAKGIDLIFVTDNDKFSKEEFETAAKEAVASLKSKFSEISKDSEIKVLLDYQKDANENAQTLYEVTEK